MPKEVKQAKKRMQVWLKEEYGPISYMQSMFNQSLVFISDFNLIKEVLKKQEASGRPKETKPFHEFRFGDSEGRVRGKKIKELYFHRYYWILYISIFCIFTCHTNFVCAKPIKSKFVEKSRLSLLFSIECRNFFSIGVVNNTIF